ncbi:hypothetical protein SJI45_09590 [Streptomyces sp. S399]|uniref:hypothetical protein n=1 Tax=Streptomyces sp. S399 TaxID=3096009 RepID=UPI002A80FF18|nr:hypothetical protein [Streptomyces sp. S399]WPR51250.1 hypothetical protein SJI45_09590 [Streptomyces sp. S399]
MGDLADAPGAGERAGDPLGGQAALGDDQAGGEAGSLQPRVLVAAETYELGFGTGDDGELAAGQPGLGVRLQADGDLVQAGDGAEDRAGVQVVGEQPGGAGEDARGEVADGELTQLQGEQRGAERWQVDADEGEPVGLQGGSGGVQPVDEGGRGRGRVDDEDVAVVLDEGVDLGERLLQAAAALAGAGGPEDGGGRGVPVG